MSFLRSIIKDISPPIILRGAKSLIRLIQEKKNSHRIMNTLGPEWYDNLAEDDLYRIHYTKSPYYFLWSVIADRALHAKIDSVLDIGCGSGQLASVLHDKGLKKYHGIDFSSKLIELAKRRKLGFDFTVADAFQTPLLETAQYDAVISTEFLEHVEGDIEIISRIRAGTTCYASVPNFPYLSHVRHFKSSDEVRERYAPFFDNFRVDAFIGNDRGKVYYLFEGIKNDKK